LSEELETKKFLVLPAALVLMTATGCNCCRDLCRFDWCRKTPTAVAMPAYATCPTAPCATCQPMTTVAPLSTYAPVMEDPGCGTPGIGAPVITTPVNPGPVYTQ
jgi:hypothetical protein